MADGELTIALGADLSARLQLAAEASGRSVEDLANGLIAYGLQDDRAEDYLRFAEFERTGVSYDAEMVLREFQANVAARAARVLHSKRHP